MRFDGDSERGLGCSLNIRPNGRPTKSRPLLDRFLSQSKNHQSWRTNDVTNDSHRLPIFLPSGATVNADWFYSVGDTRQGPVTEAELQRLAADGQLKSTDLVWRDGMADWIEAKSVPAFFPKVEARRSPDDDRPSRRGRREDDEYEDERPSRRGRRDEEYDDGRPSRRGSSRRDEIDDDDRPRVRREERYEDDFDDRPLRRRKGGQKPSQVQAVGIMMLVGGILGLLVFLAWASTCFGLLWPGVYFEVVISIMAIIRGVNMMNQDDQGPPRGIAICLIICILNLDIVNCVLGIVCLVMLNDDQVRAYYRKKGFE